MIISQRDRRTCVESVPSDKRHSTWNSSQRRKGSRNTQNAHRKLNLAEDDGGPLPADRPELDAILCLSEDIMSLLDLALRRSDVGLAVRHVRADFVVGYGRRHDVLLSRAKHAEKGGVGLHRSVSQ